MSRRGTDRSGSGPTSGQTRSGVMEITSQSAIHHMLEHKPERVLGMRIQTAGGGVLKGRLAELADRARAMGISVDLIPPKNKYAEDISPVYATVAAFGYVELRDFIESVKASPRSLVLALDHLQDPQNFGALCRSAEGMGVAGIILPRDRSVSVSPGIYHASVGAVETIPIVQVQNIGEALRKLKDAGFWIVGSALDEQAKPPWETPDFDKTVLVMGAELEGMSTLVENLCDWKVYIPLDGLVQSLNVSAAGAVLMYELTRKNREPKK